MEGQRKGIADLEEELCIEEHHHGSADVVGHHLIVEHPMVGEQNEPNAGLPRPSGVGTHDSRERRNLGHQPRGGRPPGITPKRTVDPESKRVALREEVTGSLQLHGESSDGWRDVDGVTTGAVNKRTSAFQPIRRLDRYNWRSERGAFDTDENISAGVDGGYCGQPRSVVVDQYNEEIGSIVAGTIDDKRKQHSSGRYVTVDEEIQFRPTDRDDEPNDSEYATCNEDVERDESTSPVQGGLLTETAARSVRTEAKLHSAKNGATHNDSSFEVIDRQASSDSDGRHSKMAIESHGFKEASHITQRTTNEQSQPQQSMRMASKSRKDQEKRSTETISKSQEETLESTESEDNRPSRLRSVVTIPTVSTRSRTDENHWSTTKSGYKNHFESDDGRHILKKKTPLCVRRHRNDYESNDSDKEKQSIV